MIINRINFTFCLPTFTICLMVLFNVYCCLESFVYKCISYMKRGKFFRCNSANILKKTTTIIQNYTQTIHLAQWARAFASQEKGWVFENQPRQT